MIAGRILTVEEGEVVLKLRALIRFCGEHIAEGAVRQDGERENRKDLRTWISFERHKD